MAVPSGEYELTASVDLSPVFGVLTKKTTVTVARPRDDILDVRLKELASGDPSEVRRAIYDLRYFPKDGERIVPALVSVLEGKDANLRQAAISVFGSFPKGAAEHLDLILSIATDTEGGYARGRAAYLLARFAPQDEKYEKALTDGVKSSEGSLKRQFESALDQYRRRHNQDKPAR